MPTVLIIHLFFVFFLVFALQKADLKNVGQGSHCEVPPISVAFVNVQTVCLEALAASGMNSAASL